MSMTLEQRYEAAKEDSYVGRVRLRQEESVGGNKPGVNFMDGEGRQRPNNKQDEYQNEFTRRDGGTKIFPTVPNSKVYAQSRWLEKSLKIAFDGVGPSNLLSGYFGNSRFTSLSDVRNANKTLHEYAPLTNKKFEESTVLSSFAKNRASSLRNLSYGPSPASLQG